MDKKFLLTISDSALKHCSNCAFCTDEFIDPETDTAYMWFCYKDMDTEKGISGNCDSFDPDWMIRAVTYKPQSPKYVITGEKEVPNNG